MRMANLSCKGEFELKTKKCYSCKWQKLTHVHCFGRILSCTNRIKAILVCLTRHKSSTRWVTRPWMFLNLRNQDTITPGNQPNEVSENLHLHLHELLLGCGVRSPIAIASRGFQRSSEHCVYLVALSSSSTNRHQLMLFYF